MTYVPTETHLRRMRAATLELREFAAGLKAQDLEHGRTCALALERLLQMVADAAGRIDATGRAKHPGMPWPQLDELAKTVSTARDHIDPRVLWGIVTRESPMLLEALHGALPTREYD